MKTYLGSIIPRIFQQKTGTDRKKRQQAVKLWKIFRGKIHKRWCRMAQKRLQLIEKVIPKIIEFLMKDDQGFCIANIFVEAHGIESEQK